MIATRLTRPLVIAGPGAAPIAQALQQAGLDIGRDLNDHFEDEDFVRLHDYMLAAGSPSPAFAKRARAIIDERKKRPLWGWTESRTSLFLDFWDELLPDANYLFLYQEEGVRSKVKGLSTFTFAFIERNRERCFVAYAPTALRDLNALIHQLAERFALPLSADRVDDVAALFHQMDALADLPAQPAQRQLNIVSKTLHDIETSRSFAPIRWWWKLRRRS